MQQDLLPLFPLQVVLFPRTPLPLHIFEDRYKEMIGEAIHSNTEFGVVLAGEKGIANIGCTAIVDRVIQRHDDGRLDLISSGRRRFEIQSLDQEKSYLRGAVEFFDDEGEEQEGTVSSDLKSKIVEAYNALPPGDDPVASPEWNDAQLSFQLAQRIADLQFRQVLLMMRSEQERMRHLADFLPEYAIKRINAEHIQRVAPRNGHAKHHIQLDDRK
ncbi:MAG TPA: LON peptidase substrate-binding domain-containing protein [Bryobacteraceae bacterium]|jgi:Lon protease-like protein